ncbi:MAG: type II secretion system F family protein, partial [Candidatus Eremiobacterota bacterium]
MQFVYRAADARGARHTGQLEAPSREQALQILENSGLVVWDLTPSRPVDLRLNARERCRLFMELSMMLQCGIGLVRGLEVIGAGIPVADHLATSLARGQRLSDAMQRVPACFAPGWVDMVRLGEECGGLAVLLARLADHLERQEQRRMRLLRALAYPAFTLLGATAAMALMVFVMLPRFVSLASGSGELPG